MTEFERATIRWHEFVLAHHGGKDLLAGLRLKQHFGAVERATKQVRPELYDPTNVSFFWDGRKARRDAAEKSEKA
jgi:hypothetical protein